MTAAEASAVLLIAILILGALAYMDARSRHEELIRLLNDLATMLGELFDKEKEE